MVRTEPILAVGEQHQECLMVLKQTAAIVDDDDFEWMTVLDGS